MIQINHKRKDFQKIIFVHIDVAGINFFWFRTLQYKIPLLGFGWVSLSLVNIAL